LPLTRAVCCPSPRNAPTQEPRRALKQARSARGVPPPARNFLGRRLAQACAAPGPRRAAPRRLASVRTPERRLASVPGGVQASDAATAIRPLCALTCARPCLLATDVPQQTGVCNTPPCHEATGPANYDNKWQKQARAQPAGCGQSTLRTAWPLMPSRPAFRAARMKTAFAPNAAPPRLSRTNRENRRSIRALRRATARCRWLSSPRP
jgi:hypothetical protein